MPKARALKEQLTPSVPLRRRNKPVASANSSGLNLL